jgi:phage terminase large subunit-like protein
MQTAIRINAHPHQGQKEVHEHPARFKVLAAGRRWGKTRLGVHECLDVAAQGGRAWWVAPSYKTSEVGWRPLRRMGQKIGAEVRLVEKLINLPSGGSVQVRSADDPNSLRGDGLDLVVMDENAFIKEAAWVEALRPALSDRQGKALFISTPKGHNWFWRLWVQGQDEDNADFMSWQFPTSSNPYIEPTEIDAAERSLPERVFEQEFLAHFVDDAGGVFRRVMDAATADEQITPTEGHQYIAGVDVASQVDFTVAVVMDVTTGEMAYMDRFNRVDYNILEDRLEAIYRRFKLDMITIESNSIGQGVIDHLSNRDMTVNTFTTTNATKHAAITALQSAFEHSRIKILNDPVLIGELQAFEAKRNASGTFSYAAPEGIHDDTVMALAIAWNGLAGGVWDVY